MAATAHSFEAELARLTPKGPQGWSARLVSFLLEVTRWLTCCCCCQSRHAIGPIQGSHKKDWSALKKAKTCPAQLKVSTVDKRTIEVKITYAENAAMSTQLYEVDVFMFFLKDLEAVTTNFYHDLWQSTRMHTPKIPLAAMAGGDTSDDLSGLIKQQLLIIQYKRLVGNEQDASVRHDIEHAVDSVVQQLRLQACMFRQSVRRAMKGITTKLEQAQGASANDLDVQKVSAQIGLVVQQLAEVVNNLHELCRPCDSEESPETVRETWKMVDEYMLTEAEIALVKLLESLDKAVLNYSQSVGCSAARQCKPPCQTSSNPLVRPTADSSWQNRSSPAGRASDTEEVQEDHADLSRRESTASSRSFSTTGDANAPKQAATTSIAERNIYCPPRATIQPALRQQTTAADVDVQDVSGDPAQTPNAPDALPQKMSTLEEAQAGTPCPLHRPDLVHSSASSFPVSTISRQALLTHNDSAYLQPRLHAKSSGDVISPQSSPKQHLACPDGHTSTSGQGGSQPLQGSSAPCGDHLSAAYALLCDPRQALRTKSQKPSCMSETIAEEEQQEERVWCQSNLQSLIMEARSLQEADCCTCSSSGPPAPEAKLAMLAEARQLLVDAIEHLQDEMRERSYYECIIHDDDTYHNEVYTNRIKCLKHNARAAVVLQHETLQRSFLLADVIGASVAGIAMCIAITGIYIGYRFSHYQLNPIYVLITVVAYMMKDRIKEWGKRYLEPVCVKFGFEFPDRIVKVRDSRGRRVGRCKEWAKVVGDDKVDARVLAMRHKDHTYVPKLQKATKPERVMTYRKKMEVHWDRLDPRLQCVDGLDDIMRFDLQHFCRRMQPPEEPHYRICTDSKGHKYAEQVQCARVYHINVVLRIRTSTQDKVRNKDYREKSMQIQRARVVMDQDGIKRLEATDDSVHLKSDRRALRHLSTPDWLSDVHMPSMQLPKMQMPHMKFAAFGRRLAENKGTKDLPQAEAV